MEAFETNDKAVIAEKLGYSSVQAVYKLIKGERELSFEHLVNFKKYTKRSIDWLLTGEEESGILNLRSEISEIKEPTFEETFERRVKDIVRQEISNLRSEISENRTDETDETDVVIEPAEMILAPVVARISGEDPKDQVRRMIGEGEIGEIEKRLSPRKRKAG